jgi:YbbR domain-containing protein
VTEILTKNFKLKLTAIVVATILWLLVGGQREAEVGFLVPVELKGIPGELVMVTMPPDTIEVKLAGPHNFIRNLSLGQVKIDVDLSSSKEGMNSYRIDTYDVNVPSGIEVLNVIPKHFEINMEKLISALVPVRVNFTGTPAKGFKALSITPEPTHVTISGRKKEIAKVKKLFTEIIDIEGLKDTEVATVPIDVRGRVGSVDPESVIVTVKIRAIE